MAIPSGTRLGREAAVKLLLAEAATDPQRRQRFEQEARSASALHHPNIVTVYDIGSADDTTWIAMGLVEGRTLRELLADGPHRRALPRGGDPVSLPLARPEGGTIFEL